MRQEFNARTCELITELTGYYCRHNFDEIKGFAFEFICDNGHGLAGDIRVIEVAPREFFRLWTDANVYIEWRWEGKEEKGEWKKPKLYTHVYGGRPGSFFLKPSSHTMR